MVSIDPRTMAVRAGGGGIAGPIVRLVGFTVGLGLLVHGWQGLLAPGEDADSDSYICVEDAHGCAPMAVEVTDEDRFDDEQDSALPDDALDNVAAAPRDLDNVFSTLSGGFVDDGDGDDRSENDTGAENFPAAALPAVPSIGAIASGTLSCLVGDSRGACLSWDDLPPADRALLEDLYRRNGVHLH